MDAKCPDSKCVYVMVNKMVKMKYVLNEGGRLNNPRPGTVLDHSIMKKDVYDFYLVNVQCR
jgi:hypothetical protein